MTAITLQKAMEVVELHSDLQANRNRLNRLRDADKIEVSITIRSSDHGDSIKHTSREKYDQISAAVLRMFIDKYEKKHAEIIRKFHQIGAEVPK